MTASHLGASRIAGPDACGKILVCGEGNPYGSDERYALYNEPSTSAGGRLQRRIFGIEGRRWYLPLWRVNLCIGAFDRDDAKARATELLGEAPWSLIVLLGRQVQRAFGVVAADGFIETTAPSGPERWIVGIPHPSGRNALWNDQANVDHARKILRAVAPEIPWGHLDEEDSTP
jgi:hypothetical protein